MTGEGSRVRQDATIADDRVMPDMHVSHDEAARADARGARTGSARDGHVLANVIIIAHFKPGRLAPVLQVLRGYANAREWCKAVAIACAQMPVKHHMRHQHAVFTQHHARPDRTKRADDA